MNNKKRHVFTGIALLLLAAILITGPSTPIAEGQIDHDQMYELGFAPPIEVTADLAALNEKTAVECHKIGFTELECPRSNEDTAKRVMATLMTQRVEKTKFGATGGGYAPKYAEAINQMFYEFLTRLQKKPCEPPPSNYVSEEGLEALQKGEFIHKCNAGWRIYSEWVEIIQPKEKTQNEEGSTPDVNEVTEEIVIKHTIRETTIDVKSGSILESKEKATDEIIKYTTIKTDLPETCDEILKPQLVFQKGASISERMNQVIEQIQIQRQQNCSADKWNPTATDQDKSMCFIASEMIEGRLNEVELPATLRQDRNPTGPPRKTSGRDSETNILIYWHNEVERRPTDQARCWLFIREDGRWYSRK